MVMSCITITAFIPIVVNACTTELSHLCCKKLWVTSASSREVIQIRHIGGVQFLSPCLLSMRKIITSVRPSQGWTCSWTCQTQRQIKSETVCWNNYVVFRSAQMQWVQLHEVWHQLWLHGGNTYERFADIDLAGKPLLALTSWCASHPHTESRPYFLFLFSFFFGITGKRNASLKQKINTNTFPGQTGTTRASCNLLSCTLTWKHNLPVTVDEVVKHSASLLLRISQLLQKPYQAHLLRLRYVGGCFRPYLVFTTWSHSPYKLLPNEFERHLLFWHLIDAAWCENKALHRSYTKTSRPI